MPKKVYHWEGEPGQKNDCLFQRQSNIEGKFYCRHPEVDLPESDFLHRCCYEGCPLPDKEK